MPLVVVFNYVLILKIVFFFKRLKTSCAAIYPLKTALHYKIFSSNVIQYNVWLLKILLTVICTGISEKVHYRTVNKKTIQSDLTGLKLTRAVSCSRAVLQTADQTLNPHHHTQSFPHYKYTDNGGYDDYMQKVFFRVEGGG